jgi:hypothetical protein
MSSNDFFDKKGFKPIQFIPGQPPESSEVPEGMCPDSNGYRLLPDDHIQVFCSEIS